MVIFNSYVKLPEGIYPIKPMPPFGWPFFGIRSWMSWSNEVVQVLTYGLNIISFSEARTDVTPGRWWFDGFYHVKKTRDKPTRTVFFCSGNIMAMMKWWGNGWWWWSLSIIVVLLWLLVLISTIIYYYHILLSYITIIIDDDDDDYDDDDDDDDDDAWRPFFVGGIPGAVSGWGQQKGRVRFWIWTPASRAFYSRNSLWISLNIFEYLWISLNIIEYQWISVNIIDIFDSIDGVPVFCFDSH